MSTDTVVLVVLLLVVVVVDTALLVDLSRRPVKQLPKPAWAAVILLSFPIGAILYVAVGRVRRGEEPVESPAAPPPPTSAAVVAAPPPPADGPTIDLRAVDDAGLADRHAVLTTRALRKEYGEVAAVDGVDLHVPEGGIYGLIGPNGAGKTTLLSMIAGLRRPTGGTVDLQVPREQIAVLADTPLFEPWLTAAEVVDLARHLVAPDAPPAQVADALREVGLEAVADRRVGGFSRGMLQRLGLATCLVGDPRLLVMDEPSAALDPAGRREVLDLIARLAGRRTVVLSTHVLVDVQQVCDTVGVLLEGRLVYQGSMQALLARTASAYRLQVVPPAGAVAERLAQAAWVSEAVEEAPGSFRIEVTDAAAAEAAVASLLVDAGATLRRFEPVTDLETAFFTLTSAAAAPRRTGTTQGGRE
jgi:ABC-2 type transport system ATP-binding protein